MLAGSSPFVQGVSVILSSSHVVLTRCTFVGAFVQTDGTPLLAETSSRFFIKGTPYTISFESSPAGAVTQLVIEADGQKQIAKRK